MSLVSDFEEWRLRLPDDYDAYARYWHPPVPPRAAVLYLHGIQSHCGWYEASARRLRDAGMAVLQPDRRGSGHNPEQRGHAESAEQLIDDTLCGLDQLLNRSGLRKAHLLGVSWGGKLAAAVHVTEPARIVSLTLVTPGLFPRVGVSNAEMFRIGVAMLANRTGLFDIPLNDATLFTSIPERIRFLEEDALQLHQATAGFYLASRRMDKTAQALGDAPPVPLHLLLAADERIIDNERTRQFVREMRWPHRAITTYEHSRHTLEFDPDREAYLEDLVRWFADPYAYCAGPSGVSAPC
jgi:alpha-beta hydrolase superfamily lysophospholipase